MSTLISPENDHPRRSKIMNSSEKALADALQTREEESRLWLQESEAARYRGSRTLDEEYRDYNIQVGKNFMKPVQKSNLFKEDSHEYAQMTNPSNLEKLKPIYVADHWSSTERHPLELRERDERTSSKFVEQELQQTGKRGIEIGDIPAMSVENISNDSGKNKGQEVIQSHPTDLAYMPIAKIPGPPLLLPKTEGQDDDDSDGDEGDLVSTGNYTAPKKGSLAYYSTFHQSAIYGGELLSLDDQNSTFSSSSSSSEEENSDTQNISESLKNGFRKHRYRDTDVIDPNDSLQIAKLKHHSYKANDQEEEEEEEEEGRHLSFEKVVPSQVELYRSEYGKRKHRKNRNKKSRKMPGPKNQPELNFVEDDETEDLDEAKFIKDIYRARKREQRQLRHHYDKVVPYDETDDFSSKGLLVEGDHGHIVGEAAQRRKKQGSYGAIVPKDWYKNPIKIEKEERTLVAGGGGNDSLISFANEAYEELMTLLNNKWFLLIITLISIPLLYRAMNKKNNQNNNNNINSPA